MTQAELEAITRAFDATVLKLAERFKSQVEELRAENEQLRARVEAVEAQLAAASTIDKWLAAMVERPHD